MKTFEIKAGEKKRIIYQFSNSLPQTHKFTAEPTGPDSKLGGVIEVKGSNWLFPKDGVSFDLGDINAIDKGAWDTIYSVYVTPQTDTKITLTSSPVKGRWLYIIGVLIIIAIASSMFFAVG